MLKKDSLWLGILIGIVSPFVFFGFLVLVNLVISGLFSEDQEIRRNTMFLLSIFINLLPIRIYFVSLKMDKTGRGILLITFALMLLFFMLISPLR